LNQRCVGNGGERDEADAVGKRAGDVARDFE
jgi:hypothetical protein